MASRNDGWVPQQHGAWAMLVVPYLLGTVAAVRSGLDGPRDVAVLLLLFVTWFAGYFTFNAESLWLKSRQPRRRHFVRPLATYSTVTAVAGLATLALAPRLLWWAPIYLLVTGVTLALVRRGDERSVSSGLLTTVAASLMAATVQARTPAVATADAWSLVAVCAAYFFGTVLYVKTLIRERGKPRWVWISGGYHVAVVVACLVLAAAGGSAGLTGGGDGLAGGGLTGTGAAAGWGGGAWLVWAVFFAAVAARAVLVPVLGPLRGRRVTPKKAGIGEAVASVVLVAVALLLGV